MSEKKISYLNKTFNDYKKSLIEYSNKYYPDLTDNLDEGSIGSWLIDINASIADNLSYAIDCAYNETNLDSANEVSSIYNLARSNGLHIPGPKASLCEVEFTCVIPNMNINDSSKTPVPYWGIAPIIKKGTKVSGGGVKFELLEDCDFTKQFDEEGNSNRKITPKRNSNGLIEGYIVSKLAVVASGESKIYSKVLNANEITPFMEVLIPDTNVMSIESIIFKEGTDFKNTPSINEFMYHEEKTDKENSISGADVYRYFEVENLLEQYRWGAVTEENENSKYKYPQPIIYMYGYNDEENKKIIPTYSITRGEWKPLKQKFITEYTDNGYLKVIFGGANRNRTEGYANDFASSFTKGMISRIIDNDALGVLPPNGTTMFILYRKGGGATSNIAKGAITTIDYLNVDNIKYFSSASEQKAANNVRNSIKVINTTPSISGKDMPSVNEIKYMIKYNNSAQNRCITVKDYENRVMQIPAKYGCPFRVSAIEENNKIMLYLLGIDNKGNLSDVLPSQLVKNIINYLSIYKSINDFVEIKSGKVINLSFECDLFIDKNYNKSDVVNTVINTIKKYMDINKHYMGEDIFIGDLQKEISKVDGVINLVDLRVFNEFGNGYSSTISNQEPYINSMNYNTESEYNSNIEEGRMQLDMKATDGVLYNNADSMFEIKYPENDIKIRIKTR